MTTVTIPAHDRFGVRVFSAALSPEDMQRDKASLVPTLLGDRDIDPSEVELFDVAELSDIGLAGYLTEGLGVPEAALDADRARLDALKGPVLILRSKALHGRAATLSPDPRLTLIGSYVEDRPPVHFEPLPTPAAEGVLTPTLPPGPAARPLPGIVLILGAVLVLAAVAAIWLALR